MPPERTADELIATGRYEEALAQLEAAAARDPENSTLRDEWRRQRFQAIIRLTADAEANLSAGRLDVAATAYDRILAMDPNNEVAAAGRNRLIDARRQRALVQQIRESLTGGQVDHAHAALGELKAIAPRHPDTLALEAEMEQTASSAIVAPEATLGELFQQRVSLEFREASTQAVFQFLAQATSLNFVFDRDVLRDLQTTIFLRDTPLTEVLDLILRINGLSMKVINNNTILVFPATPEKQALYLEPVIRAFYLSNVDAKQAMEMLRAVIKSENAFVDEKLNVVIVRDTPAAVHLAERALAVYDLAPAEVILELEVLEVQRSKVTELGLNFPDQVIATPLGDEDSRDLTLRDMQNLNSDMIGVDVGSLILNLKKEGGTVNLLANPRIRVRDKEKAKILIGDKVPVITTTSTSTGFVSETVQYLDVGLSLEVEPQVHLDADVAIRTNLEVSSIVGQVTSKGGTLAYQLGTRSASTVLRIRDGETQILAGLINDVERKSASGIPGLSEVPILGRLFSSHKEENQKTEIILSIRPRIVRMLHRPAVTAAQIPVGGSKVPNGQVIMQNWSGDPGRRQQLQ